MLLFCEPPSSSLPLHFVRNFWSGSPCRMAVGVPMKLLNECQGLVVSVETTSGDVYRGVVADVDDYMNTVLDDVTRTGADGRTRRVSQVVLRGSQIRLFVLPPALKFAPFFETNEA
jgi:small nuclear ribonucleoprotein D3